MSLRNILSISKEFTQLFLMLAFIVLAALAIIWLGLSVWGNLTEASPTGLPDMPSIEKAQYMIITETTGEVLLTPKFDVSISPNDRTKKNYTLHNFYKVEKGKWRYSKGEFVLDEYYWGKITIKNRG